jgi:hypothetical protein
MLIVRLFLAVVMESSLYNPAEKGKEAPSHENSNWIRDMQYDRFRSAEVPYVIKSGYIF